MYSQSQIIQQPPSNSVNFNDHPQTSQDRSEIYPFFQQNKINTNRYQSRNQPPYRTARYFPADDDEYYNQFFQRFYPSQRPRSFSIDQPDIFDPYTRQPRTNPASQNITIQTLNPINTQLYQVKCITNFHYRIFYNMT